MLVERRGPAPQMSWASAYWIQEGGNRHLGSQCVWGVLCTQEAEALLPLLAFRQALGRQIAEADALVEQVLVVQ